MRIPTLFVLVLLMLLLITGCTAPPPQGSQPDVEAAVQATLTAIATESDLGSATTSPEPAATLKASASDVQVEPKTTPAPAVARPLVLPPQVENFDPALRPASSKGDPNAPVVIYEWSDYI